MSHTGRRFLRALGVPGVAIAGAVWVSACAGLVGADFDGLTVSHDAGAVTPDSSAASNDASATDSACTTSCNGGGVCAGFPDGTTCQLTSGAASAECCGGACIDPQTDVRNCGACGSACSGPNAACGAGLCGVVLASGGMPFAIAVDSSYVYWTSQSTQANDGTVMKVPTDGGAPTTLASGLDRPYGIAVDGASVYWTNWPTNPTGSAPPSVLKVPLGGGAPMTLASGVDAHCIAVDSTSVYWAGAAASGGQALMKVPLGGGVPVTLVSTTAGLFWDIAVDANNVYWTTAAFGSSSTAVMKVPLDGGTPVAVAAEDNESCGIAVDATSVYWVDSVGAVLKAPLDGGAATILGSAGTGAEEVCAIAIDTTSAYFTSGSEGPIASGTVSKVALAGGGAALPLAAGQELAAGEAKFVAVDATSVYWTTPYGPGGSGPGAVMKAPK